MDYTIEFNAADRYFLVTTHGEFSMSDFQKLAESLLHHENWATGVSCLFDYRKTNFLKVDRQELIQAASLHQQNDDAIGRGKSALVMADIGNFGMGRMYQGITDGMVQANFGVFLDFDEALSWLGDTEEPETSFDTQ